MASWLAHPRVEHVGIYEIKDHRPDRPAIGDAPNYNLGLLRSDRTPKLAFATVRLLLELLDVGRLTVLDDRLRVEAAEAGNEPVFAHAFLRPAGDQVVFAWSRKDLASVRLTLPRAGTRATEFGLDGRALATTDLRGRRLGPMPLAAGQPKVFRVAP